MELSNKLTLHPPRV